MSLITSAGILLNSGGFYLIGGSAKDINCPTGWGIPKGKIEAGETLLQTAMREFYEETSLDVNAHPDIEIDPKPVANLKYKLKKNDKEVHVFSAIDKTGKLLNYKFKCLTFTPKGNPELSWFLWLSKDEAFKKVTKSQKELFI